MAVLIVKSPDGSERTVPLGRRLTSVGGDPESDVSLDDPALPPLALHLRFDGRDFDATAHEGVEMRVNGRRRSACRLAPGDLIQVGGSELRLADAEAPAPPGAAPGPRQAVHALVRFSERLLLANDLDRLLEELLDGLLDLTRADKGFVVLVEGGEMVVRAARNLARASIEEAGSRISDSIVQKVVRTRRPLVVADALHDEEWSSSSSVVNLKLCSVMCAPLMAKGEVFGAIYLGNDRVASLFGERDLEPLTIFASQASLLVQNALLLDGLRRENETLRQAVAERQFGEIIGAGAAMHEVFRRIEKVAGTDVNVLVFGETGTGKELVAREIHRRSRRAAGPFVPVNCAAIPEGLMESELFGHVRGAFTGAVATRPGCFQAANGGTLFLDEVGEMAPSLQVKLLRAIQERSVVKVGDTRPEAVDIRIVAATNKVLEEEVRKGTFREDLYYRLNVVSIGLPPLRERGDDVLVIARWLLQRFARELGSRARSFAPAAAVAMKKYAWPGNIRELENKVKKAAVLADGPLVTAQDLDLRPEQLEPILPLAQAKEEFQKRYINEVLDRNGGNRTKTAKDLDVDPRTVFRHLEKLEAERRTAGGEHGPEETR